jgi:hypothetical protein
VVSALRRLVAMFGRSRGLIVASGGVAAGAAGCNPAEPAVSFTSEEISEEEWFELSPDPPIGL